MPESFSKIVRPLPSCVAEPPASSVCPSGREAFHDFPTHSGDWSHHQLRDAITRTNCDALLSQIHK